MGKKLDALLGRRTFRTEKFRPTVNLAISRLTVLKNHRNARLRQSRSDVLQLLQLGQHQRALLRVEHVIKEQNMLDVYDEIEGYCNLLIERVHLIVQERECPEELKEAASGLLYAASRCGDFPEIQEIRAILTSRFGKDFAARAIELRNNCKVHPKIITKLSTRMPSLENRMRVLKEIASENSIILLLDQQVSTVIDEEEESNKEKQNQQESEIREEEKGRKDDELTDSFKVRRKYKDVADAAQAAFESAAYAADAARAAVELSRSQSHDPHDDDDDSSRSQSRKVFDGHDSVKTVSTLEIKEILTENKGVEEFNKNAEELEKPKDISSSNSDDDDDDVGDEIVVSVDAEIKVDPPIEIKADPIGIQNAPFLDLEKKPFSVRRTRHVHGY